MMVARVLVSVRFGLFVYGSCVRLWLRARTLDGFVSVSVWIFLLWFIIYPHERTRRWIDGYGPTQSTTARARALDPARVSLRESA